MSTITMASSRSPCELFTLSLSSLSISCRTSTRALRRSIRCEISRYDRAAAYRGSRSGYVLEISSCCGNEALPEELRGVKDGSNKVDIDPQDEQITDLLHDLASG